jgi:hypothetical protein
MPLSLSAGPGSASAATARTAGSISATPTHLVARSHHTKIRHRRVVHRPSKAIFRIHPRNRPAVPASRAPLTYHGGKVMSGPVDVYLIWYGDWSGKAAVPALTDLVSSLGESSYFAINTTFTDRTGAAAGPVRYAGQTTVGYTHGRRLSDAGVRRIVVDALTSRALPRSRSAVYAVLTSADVHETSGFTTRYCGWHTRTTIARTDIKFAFVGDPSLQGPRVCESQHGTTPNGDAGADAMADVLTHELDETVTDPDLDAWYDRYRNENADKCAWTYGFTYRASNGSTANLRLGDRDFLVQRNWSAATKTCQQ